MERLGSVMFFSTQPFRLLPQKPQRHHRGIGLGEGHVAVAALEEQPIDEVERRLQDFDRQQDASIGPLMRQYLDLKRQYLAQLHAQFGSEEHRSQAQQAHDSFEQYTRSHPVDEPPRREKRLDEEEQRALKQLYRKLAMQCHPDRVGGADKAAAQAWFQRLQKSYQLSDLAGLQRLQTQWALSATPATSAAPDAAAYASAPTATPAPAAGPLLAQLDALHTQRLQLLL